MGFLFRKIKEIYSTNNACKKYNTEEEGVHIFIMNDCIHIARKNLALVRLERTLDPS